MMKGNQELLGFNAFNLSFIKLSKTSKNYKQIMSSSPFNLFYFYFCNMIAKLYIILTKAPKFELLIGHTSS